MLYPELRRAQMKTVSCVRRSKSWRTLTGKVWRSSNKTWQQDITKQSENLEVKRSTGMWTIAVSDGIHVRKDVEGQLLWLQWDVKRGDFNVTS